jgi:hypothetical protein
VKELGVMMVVESGPLMGHVTVEMLAVLLAVMLVTGMGHVLVVL